MYNDLSELSNLQFGGSLVGDAVTGAKNIAKANPLKVLFALIIGIIVAATTCYFVIYKKTYDTVYKVTKSKVIAKASAFSSSSTLFLIVFSSVTVISYIVLAVLEATAKSPAGAFALGVAAR